MKLNISLRFLFIFLFIVIILLFILYYLVIIWKIFPDLANSVDSLRQSRDKVYKYKYTNPNTSDMINRFTNDFTKDKNGNKLCLDTTDSKFRTARVGSLQKTSDKNNGLLMKECNNSFSQKWISTSIPNVPNFYTIQNNEYECLGVLNNGVNNKLKIAPCDNNNTKQQWLVPNNNFSSFQNNYLGMNNCLDIIKDGENNKLMMKPCSNYISQKWSIDTN
jgi:hypothetical protein